MGTKLNLDCLDIGYGVENERHFMARGKIEDIRWLLMFRRESQNTPDV